MYIEKRKVSRQDIKRLSIKTNILLILIFIVLLFVFWNMQILKNQHYTTLASRNITKYLGIKPPRGLIRDRNRKIISENKINFSLFLIRENTKDIKKSITFASSLTGTGEKELIKRIEKYKNYPKSFMIPIEKNLPLTKVIYIESRSDEHPEFKIDIEPARAYPYKRIASHVLGYISELSPQELDREKDRGYKLGDEIGKSGIEKQYESVLRGKPGVRSVVKDHLGMIQEKISEKKPEIGHCVVLTIDIELQKYIEDIFKDYRGTIAVVDLASGGILALVSTPNFNPEFFTGSFDLEQWLALINNPDNPLHNKFIQGYYSPGSVFKIVMTLVGLQEKLITPATISHCSGTIKIYDDIRRCWNRYGHGNMNIYDAVKNSCNIYFFRLGQKTDINTIERYARMLGLGDRTEIDLPNENKGLVPSQDWKLKTRGQIWFPGDTISISIGQGMLNVTPAQILLMISTVALRGQRPTLHLIKRIEEKDGRVLQAFKPRFVQLPIDKANFEILIEGLYRVVNTGGTGWAASIKGLDICGKTGTGQIISKENPDYDTLVKEKRFTPHSWFASFAPRQSPKIAMVVFVENGGDAGAVAAPIARKIYNNIFKIEKEK